MMANTILANISTAKNGTLLANATATVAVRVLRVVAVHRPPLVYVRNTGNGTVAFSGMLVDLLQRIWEDAEITSKYELYELTSGGGGSRHTNGTWSGVMGELISGRADLALFPLTLTSLRSKYISSTVPFMDNGYAMLVKVFKLNTGYSFLLPFQTSTWLLILAALVVVVLVLSLLDSWTRRARYRALERHYGLDEAKIKRRKERVMEHATESIFMLVGQGSSPGSHSWSVKFLFICWAVFSVIMLSAYTANLTANLTVSRLGAAINTLSELKSSGRMFGVPADSSVSKYFRGSNDGLALSLDAFMVEYKDPMLGVKDVRSGAIAAYITDFPVVKGYSMDPPCDLSVSHDTFGPGQLVIGLRPNSKLLPLLDSSMLEFWETGVMSDLRRKWFIEMNSCAASQDPSSSGDGDASGLGVGSVYAVFVLLAVGVGVSTAWAVLELLYYRFGYSKVKDIQHSRTVKVALNRLTSKVIRTHHLSDRRNAATMAATAAGFPLDDQASRLGRSRSYSATGDDDGATVSSSECEFSRKYWVNRIQSQAQLPSFVVAKDEGGGGGARGRAVAGGEGRAAAAAGSFTERSRDGMGRGEVHGASRGDLEDQVEARAAEAGGSTRDAAASGGGASASTHTPHSPGNASTGRIVDKRA